MLLTVKTSVSWQEVIKIIVFIVVISWFVSGFIVDVYVYLHDVRGKEFDENYFNSECVETYVAMTALGYISLIIFFYIWCRKNKPFTRLLYKIANIGIDKRE